MYKPKQQAEAAKNDFFVESRKSQSGVQNGTDLRPDSGSAASPADRPVIGLFRNRTDIAIGTPAGAAYLAAGTVR